MRAFDPAECVGKLHQWTWIEPRRSAGPIERRVVSERGASDRSGLRIEQLAFQLRKCGQRFFRRSGDLCFLRTANAASDVEGRPAEPAIALQAPTGFIQDRCRYC